MTPKVCLVALVTVLACSGGVWPAQVEAATGGGQGLQVAPNGFYESFTTSGSGTFDAAAAVPEQFVTPGPPRAVWLALRYEMDRK